jgi:UDP-N-acetylglucosamine 2-epimerase (non-hydrolysing)
VHVLHVVGARPNFMKVAPVMRALAARFGLCQTLVHTGQHYDINMSDLFFRQLEIPAPDENLEVGSGSHAQQTAQTMSRVEAVVLKHRPDLVLVYGDVNSTVAAALVCAKLGMRVGHVEAGLRSFDRAMPEEINRLLTDQLADLLFTPSADGDTNLLREGIAAEKIHLVGNVMIDTLVHLLPAVECSDVSNRLCLKPKGYGLVTLHRPSNVDEPVMLTQLMGALAQIAADLPLIFPVHPRTRQKLAALSLPMDDPHLQFVDPLGYLEFLALQQNATVVITDSGGVQEETTYLGVPCLTVRENTERPVTVTLGTNTLVGRDLDRLRRETQSILRGATRQSYIPPLWDGKAGERIADVIASWSSR